MALDFFFLCPFFPDLNFSNTSKVAAVVGVQERTEQSHTVYLL